MNFYRSNVRYIDYNCAYLSFVRFTGCFVPNLIGFVRKTYGFVSFLQCFVPFSRCFVQLYNNYQNSTQRQIKKAEQRRLFPNYPYFVPNKRSPASPRPGTI